MAQRGTSHDNSLSRSSCECCVKAIKWIPVIFVVGIILWSYYAFVFQLCFFTISNIAEKIILLVLYHIISILFIWSYYQTIFTEIAEVPPKFRLPITELEKLYSATTDEQQKHLLEVYSKDLPITNRAVNGTVRFCEKCQIVKPDRCHHCSVCGTCVLKMDHHCPWINSCVCFNNYKFFILFLGYSLIYCIFVALASLPSFIQFWKGQLDGIGRFHILFLFFVAVMFAISLVSLFGYHIYLVLVNRTTLEAFRPPIFRFGGPDKRGYSLGAYNNFQEVFGSDKLYWFIPVFTSVGDGVQYTVQPNHQLNPSYESMGNTRVAGCTGSESNSVYIPVQNTMNYDLNSSNARSQNIKYSNSCENPNMQSNIIMIEKDNRSNGFQVST